VTSGLLEAWSQAIQASLSAASEVVSAATEHNLLLGDAREVLVREVLSTFLPKSLQIGTGQIIDGRRNHSRQIDVVIYDSRFPVFRTLGTQDIFMLEGVLATVEVKSSLNASTLRTALSNCASVKQLSPAFELSSVEDWCKRESLDYQLTDDQPPSLVDGATKKRLFDQLLPPTYIFGFRGYKRDLLALGKSMNHWSKTARAKIRTWPDAIIAQGCVVVRNDRRPFYSIDQPTGGYMAKVDAAPIKYLLKHILYRLEKRIGISVMLDDESQITLPSTAHTSIDLSGKWQRWNVQDVHSNDKG
jgi:hypothetical protein